MAGPFRSGLYRIGGVLLHPRQAFEVMAHEDVSLGLPLLLAAGISFAEGALFVASVVRVIPLPLSPVISVASPLVGIGAAVSNVVLMVIAALLIHLNAQLLGGTGDVTRALSVVAYSVLPSALPLGAFALAVLVGGLGAIGWLALGGVLWLVAAVWGVALLVIGVSVFYNLDMGSAFLAALLIPLVDLLVVIFLGKYGLVLLLAAYALAYYFSRQSRAGGVAWATSREVPAGAGVGVGEIAPGELEEEPGPEGGGGEEK